MASAFPGAPRVMKGGLVAYQFPDLVPTIIAYQYNPQEVQRQIRLRGGSGDKGTSRPESLPVGGGILAR